MFSQRKALRNALNEKKQETAVCPRQTNNRPNRPRRERHNFRKWAPRLAAIDVTRRDNKKRDWRGFREHRACMYITLTTNRRDSELRT